VPRHERSAAPDLEIVEQFGGRARVGITIECQVDEDVRIDEDHRYFLARASYLPSWRSAALNSPRHREAKEEASSDTKPRSSVSMSDESETPRDLAYRFALGTSSPSTVIVSFCFIGLYVYV
jgi:hypothetical protein